jgi:hypothetical protein
VSLALHAALGGTPAGFHVTYLKDRHYNWIKEWRRWQEEEDASWQLVLPHRRKIHSGFGSNINNNT